jgi:DNA-binding NarL/FixJ family response regulator
MARKITSATGSPPTHRAVTNTHARCSSGRPRNLSERIAAIFNGHPQWTVCGEAENGQQAIDLVLELKPDLVVLDLSMPVNGLQAAASIRRLAPSTKILIFSMHNSPQIELEALASGADAFLTKTASADTFIRTATTLLGHPFPSGRLKQTRIQQATRA